MKNFKIFLLGTICLGLFCSDANSKVKTKLPKKNKNVSRKRAKKMPKKVFDRRKRIARKYMPNKAPKKKTALSKKSQIGVQKKEKFGFWQEFKQMRKDGKKGMEEEKLFYENIAKLKQKQEKEKKQNKIDQAKLFDFVAKSHREQSRESFVPGQVMKYHEEVWL